MFRWLVRWKRKRLSKRLAMWRHDVAGNLLFRVIPPQTPYFLDTKFSFLQREGEALAHPIGIDLFLPEVPLAIDLLGPDAAPSYTQARYHVDRIAWERLQADLAHKRLVLARYRIPYLAITPEDATDPASLRDRIRILTGVHFS